MSPAPDQPAIDKLVAEITEGRTSTPSVNGHFAPANLTTPPDLEQAINKLRENPERREIFDGGIGKYPSASEADGKMFHDLAFFCTRDLAAMEEGAYRSGRVREKWDERRNGTTWLRQELAKAAERTSEVWSPPTKRQKNTVGKGGGHKAPKQGQDKPTDDELRDRWIGGNSDHCYGLQDWRRYAVGIWEAVPEEYVGRSIMRILEAAKDEGIRPDTGRLNSVRELARIESFVEDEKWDANPGILICENGVVEIETGELKEHSPWHYATTRVPYAYDPAAKGENWHKFIGDIDEDIRNFLQEFAGYTLTTDTSLERAVWLVGRAGGGKSTFLEGLQAMLGDRAGPLGLADIERSQFALHKVVGKTLVLAAEQPGGYISSHHLIQQLISGEVLTVERKHKDPYAYRPIAKVAWAMNETPRIPTSAEGLYRRVSLINFPVIAEADRDPTVKEGIKSEGAAIFNWALEGLQRLRKRGDFDIPEQVKRDTQDLRESNDPQAQFLTERCILGGVDDEEYVTKGRILYDDYKAWCEATTHKPKGTTRIGDDWKRLGLKQIRKTEGVYWGGVKLRFDHKHHGYFGGS